MLYRERDAQYYERMKTDELEEILRNDADGTGEFIEDSELLVIMEVVSKRHKESGKVVKSAEESWDEFKKFYMPDADTYQDVDIIEGNAKSVKVIPWLRYATTVAAVLAIIFVGSFTARAFGLDIWKELFIWTEDAFEIPDNTDAVPTIIEDNGLQISSLQEAHIIFGIPQEIKVFEMPVGFEIAGADVNETPDTSKIIVIFQNAEKKIRVQYTRYAESLEIKYEANGEVMDNLELNGINYSILSNNEEYRIVWRYENYECSISGDLTLKDAYQIIEQFE